MDFNNPNNPNNRLQLNFGNNERNSHFNDRAYPTTPSTFPQPVFQSQAAGQDHLGQLQQAPNGFGGGTAAGGGYFQNTNPNLYPTQQYAAQNQNNAYQQSYQSPSFPQSGRGPMFANDGANGLASQLSHQHLGNAPPARAMAAGYRPQQAQGNQGRKPSIPSPYPSYLNPLNGSNNASASSLDEKAIPDKNPEAYSGLNSKQSGILTGEYVANFFKQNVGRARDRNER